LPQVKTVKGDEPQPPFIVVVTSQGQVIRTPYLPFKVASTKAGRMYARLNDGDKVVLVALADKHKSMMLASRNGHVIHFDLDEVNILSGVGKGVMGIKLEDDDICLGGLLIGSKDDVLQVETSNEKTLDFKGSKYDLVARGGKGFEAVKRSNFVRVIPPQINLINWDEVVQEELKKS
jgi:DNA gyrase subunit A